MLTVVAGLIVRGSQVLVCQRRRDDSQAFKWEFPGGKVEPGESLKQALARELREELGVDAAIGKEIFRITHRYVKLEKEVLLIFFQAGIADSAVPRNLAFEKIEWTDVSALTQYDFLEGDRGFIASLAAGEIHLD